MKKITPEALDLLAQSGMPTMTLHLYSSTAAPDNAGTFGSTDFTEASTNDGYAVVTLESSGWSYSSTGGLTTSGYPEVIATYAQQDFTFTSTGARTMYGWYTQSTGDTYLWAEQFSPAASLPSGSGTISINPRHVFGVQES